MVIHWINVNIVFIYNAKAQRAICTCVMHKHYSGNRSKSVIFLISSSLIQELNFPSKAITTNFWAVWYCVTQLV